MRGKVKLFIGEVVFQRITPAYAGKSSTFWMELMNGGDHPRVCGEKGLTFHQMLRPTGSPPRMRGKADHV